MASFGVLNPSPMFLKYLTPVVVFLAKSFLVFKKTFSCFWNDLSFWIKKIGYLILSHDVGW